MQTIKEIAKNFLENICEKDARKKKDGISTGYCDLDELLTGIRPGEITVVTDPAGNYCSKFFLNMVRNIAYISTKTPILVCSDSKPDNWVLQLLTVETGRKFTAVWQIIKNLKNEDTKTYSAFHFLKNVQVHYMEFNGINENFEAEVNSAYEEHHYDVIFVDNVTAAECSSLRALARKLNVAVIASVPACQHNDILTCRRSADIVLSLEKIKEGDPENPEQHLKLHVLKNSRGPCGTVDKTFIFSPETGVVKSSSPLYTPWEEVSEEQPESRNC